MRVNVYAEEMTDRVEVISKGEFTGLRFWLELPVTIPAVGGGTRQVSGPFMHHPGDEDSSAVTFWGKGTLREVLAEAIDKLDAHYAAKLGPAIDVPGVDPVEGVSFHKFTPEMVKAMDQATLPNQAVRAPSLDMGCTGRGIAAHYTLGYHRRNEEARDGVEAYHVCPNSGCSLFDKEVA
jgi:hypothetical protein